MNQLSYIGRRKTGLTLIELLLVMVIIAIIGTIAYPTYRNHAVRVRSSDAKVKLLEVMQEQRKFYTNNNTYTTDLIGDLHYSDAGSGAVATDQNLYMITASQCGTESLTQCVNLTATPQNAQTGSITFTYNSRNQKTPSTDW